MDIVKKGKFGSIGIQKFLGSIVFLYFYPLLDNKYGGGACSKSFEALFARILGISGLNYVTSQLFKMGQQKLAIDANGIC